MMLCGWQTASSKESFTQVKAVDCIMAKRYFIMDDGKGDEARMVSSLYLGSTGNTQGMVLAYDLTTEVTYSQLCPCQSSW